MPDTTTALARDWRARIAAIAEMTPDSVDDAADSDWTPTEYRKARRSLLRARALRVPMRMRAMGVPKRLWDPIDDTGLPAWHPQTFGPSAPLLRGLARQLRDGGAVLFHSPGTGTGKTRRAAALLNLTLRAEIVRLYFEQPKHLAIAADPPEAPDFGGDFRWVLETSWLAKLRSSEPAEVRHHVGEVRDARFLVFDDIGSEAALTPTMLRHLFDVIEYRERHCLPTVLTSQHAPGGLRARWADVDEHTAQRAISRLEGSLIVPAIPVPGDDHRVRGERT